MSILKDSERNLNKHYLAQLAKISYSNDFNSPGQVKSNNYSYISDSIQPCAHFYKLLSLRPCGQNHKNLLNLNLPDTIVFNDKDNPSMWFFTNYLGEVRRADNVSFQQILSKFSQGSFEKELVAVIKKPSHSNTGNHIQVVNAQQLRTVLSEITNNRAQIQVLQRFVKSSSVKPSLMRTCWRMNSLHQGWIISSTHTYTEQSKVNQINKLIVNTKLPNAYEVMKCTSIKHLNQTLIYNQRIVKFLESFLSLRFKQLVADYIRDEGGNWWLINVKAFILQKPQIKVNLNPILQHQHSDNPHFKHIQTYTRCKKCKYCYKVLAEHLFTHKLTLMMLLQCDMHLIQMGKSLKWLKRCYSQHIGAVNLYVQHPVCDSCFKFYTQLNKLVILKRKLALKTGVIGAENEQSSISVTLAPYFQGDDNLELGSRFQKIKYNPKSPQIFVDNTQKQSKILQIQCKSIKKCMLLLFLHSICDIPQAAWQDTHKYSIRYQFLGQKVVYPLEKTKFNSQKQEGLLQFQMRKIKIFYFFIQNRQMLNLFINNHKGIVINLYRDDYQIGLLSIGLQEFKSDKVVIKNLSSLFSGRQIKPYLSWRLHSSVGIYEGNTLDSSPLKLQLINDLFVAFKGNFSYDPLPPDWLQMIEQLTPCLPNSTPSNLPPIQDEVPQKDQPPNLHDEIQSYLTNSKKTAKKQLSRRPYY